MKKIIILSLIIFTSKSLFGQICDAKQVVLTQNGVCDWNDYVLYFEDNFDGSTLDQTKWEIPYQGVIRDYSHSLEKQWYVNTGNNPYIATNNNIIVSNGTLKLIAKRETPPIIGTYISNFNPITNTTGSFDYSSAEISSKHKFGYGKFEIRCKIPSGRGFWPAFWTFGTGPGNENNEIDVFEFWDNNTVDLNMTLHYNGYRCLSDFYGAVDFSQAFHTYCVTWDNYRIVWYVDGVDIRSTYKFYTLLGGEVGCNSLIAPAAYLLNKGYPKDPMNIIANLALQTGVFAPNNSTPFPGVYEIDYIRYYKQFQCVGPLNLTNINILNLSNQIYNVVMRESINAFGNFIIPNGQQLDFVAKDQINIATEFSAVQGSDFIARIDETICPNVLRSNPYSASNLLDSVFLISKNDKSELIIYTGSDVDLFTLFPNPNKGLFYIEFNQDNQSDYEIYLFDEFGRYLLAVAPTKERKIEINLLDKAKGNYLLAVLNKIDHNIVVKKIIYQ